MKWYGILIRKASLVITLAAALLTAVSATARPQEGPRENTGLPRIIALAPHIVEMLYDVGAGGQIIGTTDFADYPEQAKDIPSIGNYVRLQLEKVITLQPDLIIAWKSGNPSDDLARLRQLGFEIVYSEPKTFSDIAKELRRFADLSGHSEQGQQVADDFLKQLEKIKESYRDKQSVTAFYELWSRPLTTVAKGSWPQQHLNICGAKNPFEQVSSPYPQVNIEQVLKTQIQLIIQPLSQNQKDREGFNWRDWPTIQAVKENNILTPDADALHRMTRRSLQALDKLCSDIDKVRRSYLSGI
ncbi:cobalamin-binding protein [Thalassomonas viridans]|uniref:Cobalamin-binding protein n=1 Tax=Thalassomonas viridans TaxID=137584 RepID=A0AAF0CAH8_9GAMM|nr:cobalamin-binding protein [Thalassomonas viridans]WDE06541.1 cobalamin-binding protein [Thalassomonas viridans]